MVLPAAVGTTVYYRAGVRGCSHRESFLVGGRLVCVWWRSVCREKY
jgi:hypothetical protein